MNVKDQERAVDYRVYDDREDQAADDQEEAIYEYRI